MSINSSFKNTLTIKSKTELKTRLKPLSEYKGPILKLTSKEQERITKLNQKISELEVDLISIEKKLNKNPKIITKENVILTKLKQEADAKILMLKKIIKDIKINRLNIQKKELNMHNN